MIMSFRTQLTRSPVASPPDPEESVPQTRNVPPMTTGSRSHGLSNRHSVESNFAGSRAVSPGLLVSWVPENPSD